MNQSSHDEFEQYVRASRAELRRRAYRLCREWHDAEDLVQASLLKLYLRWPTLDRRDELSPYVSRLMVRTFLSRNRTATRAREVVADPLPEPAPAPAEHERVPDRLLLQEALGRLGERQRATVVLRYWALLSVEETAQALGCSPATVRSQASRALATLRATLPTEARRVR